MSYLIKIFLSLGPKEILQCFLLEASLFYFSHVSGLHIIQNFALSLVSQGFDCSCYFHSISNSSLQFIAKEQQQTNRQTKNTTQNYIPL